MGVDGGKGVSIRAEMKALRSKEMAEEVGMVLRGVKGEELLLGLRGKHERKK